MPGACALRKAVAWIAFGMLWVFSAHAASPVLATVAPSLTDIPLRAMGAAVLLSLIGGAARTAQKLSNPQVIVFSVPRLITSDVLTSIAVGSATFFLVAWRELDPLLQAFAITVAGYGGSTILENYVGAFVRRLNGTPKNDNP